MIVDGFLESIRLTIRTTYQRSLLVLRWSRREIIDVPSYSTRETAPGTGELVSCFSPEAAASSSFVGVIRPDARFESVISSFVGGAGLTGRIVCAVSAFAFGCPRLSAKKGGVWYSHTDVSTAVNGLHRCTLAPGPTSLC